MAEVTLSGVTKIFPGGDVPTPERVLEAARVGGCEAVHDESLRRHDPQIYEQHRRAGYIEGGTDPSPVVVTFTFPTPLLPSACASANEIGL